VLIFATAQVRTAARYAIHSVHQRRSAEENIEWYDPWLLGLS